jgi:hypothetical protein
VNRQDVAVAGLAQRPVPPATPAATVTPLLGAGVTAVQPTVVYIAGSGRSGSTLVERMLGAVPGVVNVGETVELFRGLLTKSFDGRPEQCGCGAPILECPFWTGVADRAFGGFTEELARDVVSLQRAVAAQRHLPQLTATSLAGRRFRADLAAWAEVMVALYGAVLAQSHAKVVVDASKWPAHAMALWRTQRLDVRVLHLIRDVRGVAASWGKQGVVRPNSGARQETMRSHRPASTAARWSLFQAEVAALATRVPHAALLRYEDVVAAPAPALRAVLTALDLEGAGVDVGPAALAHVRDTAVVLGPSHGLAGNPSRFRHGTVELRLDEAWRESMPAAERGLLAALGTPGMLIGGYARKGARR